MDPNISARLKHHFKLVAPPHPTAAVAAVQPLPVTGFTARHPDKWAYVSIVERLPQILRQLQKTGGLTSAQADAICDAIAVNALLPKMYALHLFASNPCGTTRKKNLPEHFQVFLH